MASEQDSKAVLMQFVKFLAVGGAGTVLNLAIFWLGLRAQHNLTASTVV